MKLRPQNSGPAPDAAARCPSRAAAGVALIITLIMISVITFMAITFLALSRREKGQVATTTEQLTARLAADAAQERAVAQLLAAISATTNTSDFGLLVSTNFINPHGFDLVAVDGRTNVNYDHVLSGRPLSPAQALRNLNNLFYAPRPPVFITNKLFGSNEFRFYLDLNRDQVYTPNGRLIVTNAAGGFYDTNGTPIPASSAPSRNTLSNDFVGDPEYIGILRRAEQTHSADNEFLSRYAFIVLPAGKTLDLNYIHNYARLMNPGLVAGVGDGFRRNQGVSSAEINLGSFFVDLNTNAWPGPNQNATPLGSLYQYLPDGAGNTGAAFDDALSFLRYRYATNYKFLQAAGGASSDRDGIDAYARSPLMSNVFGLTLDRDVIVNGLTPYWHGSANPSHYFTSQDFFDRNKTQIGLPNGVLGFTDRLSRVATNSLSSYDRYTYYRMLSQLGTDSAAEPDTKLNLNYVNVGGLRATNFVSWNDTDLRNGDAARGIPAFGRPGSEVFFINAADRLVRRYSEEWRKLDYQTDPSLFTYTNTFGTSNTFGLIPLQTAGAAEPPGIPICVNGRFVYPPSLHRQLQLAANLWDAVNPAYFAGSTNAIPTVFRPVFTRSNLNIYITDFKEVTRYSDIQGLPMRDLSDTNVVASVQPNDLLFGVPLIIGARKGLPNFNEFSSEAVISITRKVELRRSALNTPVNQTNQMFIIGISNVFGAEFWNSYTQIYPRPVQVLVTNYCSMALTNDFAYNQRKDLVAFGNTNLTSWPAWVKTKQAAFIVPMRTNHIIVPDSTYRHSTASFIPLTTDFEASASQLWFPRWGLTITNRLVGIIKEPGTKGRILDYVQLNNMVSHRSITLDLAESPLDSRYLSNGVYGVWATNSPDGNHLSDRLGVAKQVKISMGDVVADKDWENNTANQQSGATKYQAIANFLYFMKKEPTYQPGDGRTYRGTNTGDGLVATVPFSPTYKYSIPIKYQANDPLVHYTTGDLEYLEQSGVTNRWTPPNTNHVTLDNLGKLNQRYSPWGGNPNYIAGDTSGNKQLDFLVTVKDPGVTKSDDWQFPTNKLPTLGWIGRVHRGTPWQTVYLKSTRAEEALSATFTNDIRGPLNPTNAWQRWTGNRMAWRRNGLQWNDAYMTQPEQDRTWLDLFTTALNDNATRGQLPINQSGLAAWSAVFGGMVALTNTVASIDLSPAAALTGYGAQVIDPAGAFDPAAPNTRSPVKKIVDSINQTRTNFPGQTFRRLGDLLAAPLLSEASPFLNQSSPELTQRGLNDVAYEWLPQQMLSLVRLGEPRFVIYSFGQTLKPAPRGVLVSGTYQGMITNYQITAEVATRAVVRVVGSPDPETLTRGSPKYQSDSDKRYPPRIVVENFNVLPPD